MDTLILDALIEREALIPGKPLRNAFLRLLRKKIQTLTAEERSDQKRILQIIDETAATMIEKACKRAGKEVYLEEFGEK